MSKKLAVAFLWHMHQPLYKDLLSGEYYLPWVRLHSTYSYLDMAKVLDFFPFVKCTFNLTPSLIYQLIDISNGGAKKDIYFNLSIKKAADLTREDKEFILKNFFSANEKMAIYPIRRYKELFDRRGREVNKKALDAKVNHFNDDDFRDIQALFNLAWCGFTLKNNNDFIKYLLKKGHSYTEDEKKELLTIQEETVKSILPLYKNLQDEGRIEISTTPYYHPILPLINGKTHRSYGFSQDAVEQIRKSVELYKNVFGKTPSGMWPAEGGVSADIIPLFAEAGIKWIATDEKILFNSFHGAGRGRDDLLFSAYEACYHDKKVSMVFRDINLSDSIGFRYSSMPGDEGAMELFNNIVNISKAINYHERDHIVSIILDGENPWPYYYDGGESFLKEIYKMVSSSNKVESVLISDYIERSAKEKIKDLKAGSWINADFSKWIGSKQKNRAWELLKNTRDALEKSASKDTKAWEEIYIAEGSDWFWWYDDFGTELNFVFDEIFRLHLLNVYKIIGEKAPDDLKAPICGHKIMDKRLDSERHLEMM